MSLTVNANQSKDQVNLVACAGTCTGKTRHVVAQSMDVKGTAVTSMDSEGNEETVDWSDHFQIVQCMGCETFSFRHLHWFSEDEAFYSPIDQNDGTTEHLYPRRGNDVRIAKEFLNVPRNLVLIYKEIVSCLNNNSPVLCAAGLRAAIDGLCAAEGVTNGPVARTKDDGSTETKRLSTLEGKISGLAEKNIITQSHADILHEHRYLGNDAVHELTRLSEDELNTALDIVEHTFAGLYEMPPKGATLRASRARRNAP